MSIAPAARPSRVTLIVAVARNGTIGRGNALPWHLPEDLKHFRRTTLGSPIVMGRRTFESIGRPLPERRNIVVSGTPGWRADGVETFGSIDAALAACVDEPDVFVIGGAQLFRAALPIADRAIVTEIEADFDGDTHLEPLDPSAWHPTSRTESTAAGGLRYAIVVYERSRAETRGAAGASRH